MTTTPTASHELPDLDKLEALARAATPGEWKAMPHGRVVGGPLRHYVNGSAKAQIASFGVTFHEQAPEDEPERQQANANFAAAANPEQVLALIALARRAQPEGEAPQAKDTPESMAQSNARFAIDGAIQYGRENRNEPPSTDHWLYEYWNIGRQLAQLGATGWDNVTPTPAATLSPLCGAQHAESGKEVEPFKWPNGCDSTIPRALRYLANNPRPSGGEQTFNGAHLYQLAGEMEAAARVLAAQQAAAPGTLEKSARALAEKWHKDAVDTGFATSEAAVELLEVLDAATSAPGIPEAPKPPFPISDDEMAALRRFWECATDDEGYDVSKRMMQRLADMGLVQRKSGSYYMSTDFGLYVLGEYTIDSTAQLDGGQEGSESNG